LGPPAQNLKMQPATLILPSTTVVHWPFQVPP
jgi:hypothetical protein